MEVLVGVHLFINTDVLHILRQFLLFHILHIALFSQEDALAQKIFFYKAGSTNKLGAEGPFSWDGGAD